MNDKTNEVNYSVIIPVSSKEKIHSLQNLINQLINQSLPPKEIHIIVGDNRQGRAINLGVKNSSTKYIATVDDDTEIDDNALFEKIIKAMEEDESIGMAGAACEIPPTASNLQKRAMRQIPRRFFPKQKENIDSDMVQHPCLVMRKDFFLQIGGEDEQIIRGLDPFLRKKVRDAGKRVVIIANTWVYHLLPNSILKLIKMYYRNGKGSAFAQKYFPEKIFELTNGFDKGKFKEKRPLAFRVIRRILNTFFAIICLNEIRFLTDIAYIAGYLSELLFPSYPEKSSILEIKTEKEIRNNAVVVIHYVSLEESSKNTNQT